MGKEKRELSFLYMFSVTQGWDSSYCSGETSFQSGDPWVLTFKAAKLEWTHYSFMNSIKLVITWQNSFIILTSDFAVRWVVCKVFLCVKYWCFLCQVLRFNLVVVTRTLPPLHRNWKCCLTLHLEALSNVCLNLTCQSLSE